MATALIRKALPSILGAAFLVGCSSDSNDTDDSATAAQLAPTAELADGSDSVAPVTGDTAITNLVSLAENSPLAEGISLTELASATDIDLASLADGTTELDASNLPSEQALLDSGFTAQQIAEFQMFVNDPDAIESALNAVNESGLLANGVSASGVEALLSTDPQSPVSIEDLDPSIRELFEQSLAEENANGFTEVTEFDATEIIDINNFIIGTDVNDTNLIFEVATLPDLILSDYDYIGYTHPNYSVNTVVADLQNGTLRRVFRHHTSGNILIVEESVQNALNGSTIIAEAVNESVAGLPAIFGIKKSPSDRTYASLVWNTAAHSFILYQFDDLDNARATLINVGEALTAVN